MRAARDVIIGKDLSVPQLVMMLTAIEPRMEVENLYECLALELDVDLWGEGCELDLDLGEWLETGKVTLDHAIAELVREWIRQRRREEKLATLEEMIGALEDWGVVGVRAEMQARVFGEDEMGTATAETSQSVEGGGGEEENISGGKKRRLKEEEAMELEGSEPSASASASKQNGVGPSLADLSGTTIVKNDVDLSPSGSEELRSEVPGTVEMRTATAEESQSQLVKGGRGEEKYSGGKRRRLGSEWESPASEPEPEQNEQGRRSSVVLSDHSQETSGYDSRAEFFRAIRRCDDEETKVRKLLRLDMTLSSARDSNQQSPLHVAVESAEKLFGGARLNIIKLLIEVVSEAELYARNEWRWIFLHKLFKPGTTITPEQVDELVQFLVKKQLVKLVNAQNTEGATPMHYLLSSVEVAGSTLKLLQKGGADFKMVSASGDSVLAFAIHGGRSKDTLSLLIQLGADFKIVNRFGMNLLSVAAQFGNAEALEFLIRKRFGLDLNQQDRWGRAPLHHVLIEKDKDRRLKCGEVLVSHGASKLVEDGDGKTPYVRLIGERDTKHDELLALLWYKPPDGGRFHLIPL